MKMQGYPYSELSPRRQIGNFGSKTLQTKSVKREKSQKSSTHKVFLIFRDFECTFSMHVFESIRDFLKKHDEDFSGIMTLQTKKRLLCIENISNHYQQQV